MELMNDHTKFKQIFQSQILMEQKSDGLNLLPSMQQWANHQMEKLKRRKWTFLFSSLCVLVVF